MKSAIIMIALTLAAGGAKPARAGYMLGTAIAVAGADGAATVTDGQYSGIPDAAHGTPIAASAFTSGTSELGTASGSANADVFLVQAVGLSEGFTWLLHADAQESGTGVNGYAAGGKSIATATWQDVGYLGNADPLVVGETLRLNFSSTLSIASSGTSVLGGASTLVQATGAFGEFSSAGTSLDGGGTFQHDNWDSFQSLGGGAYLGTWHLDLQLSHEYIPGRPGSFFYEVSDNSTAAGQFIGGSIYASDPLQFASITLPDVGNVTPESLGISLAFDSGVSSPNLKVAPEPSTLTLFGIGSLGLILSARRRLATNSPSSRTISVH